MATVNANISKSDQISDGARYVFINAFVFFSAFLLRDLVVKIWDHSFKTRDISFWRSIGYQILLFFLVFSITLLAGMFWTNNGTSVIG
jgi:hypothetical protein